MSEGLIAFLSARLDEDEAAASAAVDSSHRGKCAEWIARPDGNGYVIGDETGHFAFCLAGASESDMRHIVRHDPARVLREVEAKRAIVALAAKARQWTEGSAGATAGYASAIIGDTLRHMAAVYSDRPEYRPEWAP